MPSFKPASLRAFLRLRKDFSGCHLFPIQNYRLLISTEIKNVETQQMVANQNTPVREFLIGSILIFLIFLIFKHV